MSPPMPLQPPLTPTFKIIIRDEERRPHPTPPPRRPSPKEGLSSCCQEAQLQQRVRQRPQPQAARAQCCGGWQACLEAKAIATGRLASLHTWEQGPRALGLLGSGSAWIWHKDSNLGGRAWIWHNYSNLGWEVLGSEQLVEG
eukprot:364250-Chlamydomonas_euryale.AAC.6